MPIPMFLAVAFIAVNFVMTRLSAKSKDFSTKSLFDPYCLFSDTSSSYNHIVIRYYGMRWGNEHEDISYSICGSKMKRA